MRSGILGVCFGNDIHHLRELVSRSTRMTHTDPKAQWSALAVALAAHVAAVDPAPADWPARYRGALAVRMDPQAAELSDLLGRAIDSAGLGQDTQAFAHALGLERGVTGYVLHTVPVVIQAWLRHGADFRAAITAVVRCGGDTDSTAAILGSILGAAVGKAGLPGDWLADLAEWPCSVAWMESAGARLAEVLESNSAQPAVAKSYAGLAVRNLLFALIVLGHGFRRLLPPY
jgi:ADP-ribosylglycohydrolase